MQHDWIPRIEQRDMPPALANYLEPRVKRLGYLGEMFKVGANAPEVLLDFMRFTESLKAAVPFDAGETVVLSVAALMRNDYERHQHERLCVRNGLSREWIAQVQTLEPQRTSLMTPAQRAAQAFALALVRSAGRGAGAEFDALAPHFTPAQAMALSFLVGRYMTHALIVNLLGLVAPVPSIFEDGFAG